MMLRQVHTLGRIRIRIRRIATCTCAIATGGTGGATASTLRRNAFGNNGLRRRPLTTVKEGEDEAANDYAAATTTGTGTGTGSDGTLFSDVNAPSLESAATTAAKAPNGAGSGLPPPPPPLSSSLSSPSSAGGIGLPPPPPPLSSLASASVSASASASASTVGAKSFKLPPPPPPLNIVGGASAEQKASSNMTVSGKAVRADSIGKANGGDKYGSKGPKRIIIDDILFGKPPPTDTAAAPTGSVLPIADEQDDNTDNEDEHVDAHVTFHPLTTAQSRAEMHGASKKGSNDGTTGNRSSSMVGLLSDIDDGESIPAESHDEKDREQNDEVELEDPIGRTVSGSTSILPRADLSDLLPPSLGDGDEKPSFRSKSLLPSVESLFDEEGNKKKNLRIGTGVPDAYRIKKETDNSENGRKGRRKRKGGISSTNSRRTVASPSVLDQSVQIKAIQDGPRIRYGTGKIAQLAKGCVMASSGKTLVMSTVVHESSSPSSSSALSSGASSKDRRVADAMKRQCRKHTGMLPLTVSYSERYAGAGKIPTNKSRRDNMRPTEAETLASRAIDRALRPLLPREYYGSDDAIEINCSVQSFDVSGDTLSGDPIAVAINAASSALLRSGLPISEPVGAVRLCLDCEGSVTFDPSPEQVESAQLDLLVAATRNDIVMIEFGANAPRAYRDDADNDDEAESNIYANRSPGISEEVVADLLRLAHATIQNIIDEQKRDAVVGSPDDKSVSDANLMAELGLDVSNIPSNRLEDDLPEGEDEVAAKEIIEEAFQFISSRLGEAARRLFGSGLSDSNIKVSDSNPVEASIYDGEPLLEKSVRGRREHLVRQEISRLLSDEFVPAKEDLCALYQIIKASEDGGALDDLVSSMNERLLKEAMSRCAIELGTRGDGRAGPNHQGLLSIRPIEANVPLLPDMVHGSALFSRGETQVLCTATLGAPREGLAISDPYATTSSSTALAESSRSEKGPYDDLPVGSLRFLKNQQALESDLNSKRVRADREMTGDSGSLGEARRAFLHYDFPSYSTGEPRRPGPAVNRRAIGHGTLAERGILPILPPPATFPYTIRMTSEVTSSNGSSSMASVCGATLALLDAGVPILAPAAGVSVGLVRNESNSEESYAYLLDLTGTEDHYGEMDFKVCGTDNGLTAMQLDVKRPVPLDIVIQAMDVAREGRNAILLSMSADAEASSAGVIQDLAPRRRPKPSAPRVEIVRFDPARKRDLVGPGGAVLKQLEDRYGVSLDLSQEGQCLLYGNDGPAVSKAKAAVQDLVADVVEGEIYQGTVIEIKDFGAVVELLRNKEGLLHVSELGSDETQHPEGNFGLVRKELGIGDQISVRCIGVDPVQGHIKLSRKSLVNDDLVV